MANRRQHSLGWIALVLSTGACCFWAFWGAVEAFHEGWWKPTLGGRLLQAGAYMIPMLILLALALAAVWRPRLGAVVFFLFGVWFSWFIFSNNWQRITLAAVLSWCPVTLVLIGVGLLWWWGRPEPRRLAFAITLGLPLLTALACGAYPGWRAMHRTDDGIRTERLVEGNGVRLVWAPAGPGWVRDAKHACNWNEAQRICAYLSRDGQRLEATPQHIWRLPTLDEAVRSLTYRSRNAGGAWDAMARRASYRVQPEKESPLWEVYAETIYWWTATEPAPDQAYRIVYNGLVVPLPKSLGMGSQGFRAVRDPLPGELSAAP